jgi:hypothetical protein
MIVRSENCGGRPILVAFVRLQDGACDAEGLTRESRFGRRSSFRNEEGEKLG